MQNIIEIVKAVLGLELTPEQETELNKQTAANYKTIAEFNKKLTAIETERDGYKGRAETAEQALQGFEGVDLETMKSQLAEAQAQAAQAKADFERQIKERDFNDALRTALDGYKFSSEAAKAAIESELRGKGLSLVDGKIVGLSDVMDLIKQRDASAFAAEGPEDPPRFTGKMTGGGSGKKYSSREEIMAIKDAVERQRAIGENLQFFN